MAMLVFRRVFIIYIIPSSFVEREDENKHLQLIEGYWYAAWRHIFFLNIKDSPQKSRGLIHPASSDDSGETIVDTMQELVGHTALAGPIPMKNMLDFI